MPDTHSIDVQLQQPFAVGGRPCSRLAVWLLAATACRALEGRGRVVSAAELAAQVASAAAVPMAVSRAFGLLGRCGVAVGWGPDVTQAPATLALRGRRRGPFWMPLQTAQRLRFLMGERPASAQELARFAGAAGAEAPRVAAPVRGAVEVGDLDRWYALLDVRQRSEEGGHGAGGTAPAAHWLRELRYAPHERLAQAWARFHAARQARRAGDVAGARRGLQALVRELQPAAGEREQAALALARIGLVWCDHQARRLREAEAGLELLSLEAQREDGAVWRMNSRIACEFHNLRALIVRARLLEGGPAPAARGALVRDVLADLRTALICAVESDSFTLLESVAGNLGYTLWLLEAWLPPEVARQGSRIEALRWMLLSEWLCQRHGLAAGSPWNLINVCRVARGAGHASDHAAAAPLPLARVRESLGLTASLLGPPAQVRQWVDVTAALAASARAADGDYTAVQQVAALVEHAWQLGATTGRAAELQRLRADVLARLPRLAAVDRRFFRHEIDAAIPAA
jgi:hypothetical protein